RLESAKCRCHRGSRLHAPQYRKWLSLSDPFLAQRQTPANCSSLFYQTGSSGFCFRGSHAQMIFSGSGIFSFALTGRQASPILLFVVFQILPGSDMGHPFGMIFIPANRFPEPLFERNSRSPTQFSFDLRGIHGITAIVTRAITNK